MKLRERIDNFLHPNKLKRYDLKFSLNLNLTPLFLSLLDQPYHLECLDYNEDGKKHLIVLASNKKEALLMRKYVIAEGLEG